MKRLDKIAIVLTACMIAITMIAGCINNKVNLSDTKKNRLIADENLQLKEALTERDKEIENQKTLVEQCRQQIKGLEEQLQKTVDDLSNDSIKDFEEIVRLTEENKSLKSQIEVLVNQLQELAPPPSPQSP